MKLTAEISMYPFTKEFHVPIRGFIARLNAYEGLRVTTYPTATVIVGEHDSVMDALKDALRWRQAEYGVCVFVTKFITDYEAN